MKNTLLLIVFILFVTSNTFAETITVTNNADSGVGTLRNAVANAKNGDVIVFNNSITTVYFAGVIIIDKNITIRGNDTNNTIFQNAAVWTDTAHKKRYFEILQNAEVTLNYLTLKDNTANCSGGAITNDGKLILNNCIFSNNRALDSGGAIYSISGSTLKVNNCFFSKNYAPSLGGAIMNNGDLNINNGIFNDNYGGNAGAIYNGSHGGTCNINDGTFTNNSASYDSAISNYGDLQITNSIFQENNSTQDATINNNKNATIVNCLFTQNTVENGLNPERGIITNSLSYSVSSTTIINSTIVNNYGGHGVYISRGNSLSIYNSILFDNAKNDIHYILGNLIVQNCLIGTSNIDLNNNNNIIAEDPLFVDNGYSPQQASPAIDAGDNTYLPVWLTKDLAGESRIRNNTVDMGAYEFQSSTSSASSPASAVTSNIYTRYHTIIIENAVGNISIHSTTGQLIAHGTQTEFSVPTAGIYIVRVGNHIQKVMVK